MNIQEVLNEFARFAEYDPNQTRFVLGSANDRFHEAGKDIKMLLSGYDPTGALSIIRARAALMDVAKDKRIPLYEWLANPDIAKEMLQYQDIWEKINDSDVLEQTDEYLHSIDETFQNAIGIHAIGDRDMEKERQQFLTSTMQVIQDLTKLKVDVYQKGATPIGDIKKFSTRILVFERMSDCLLHISNEADAIYLCYISQHQSPDGYFAFIIKSNGNIAALHDRIDEAYIGQHKNLRNGRWTDEHMDRLFPYNYIFHYAKHDYKGYATKYMIDDEKLDFVKLGTEVYQPLLIMMLIIKNKYAGVALQEESLFLNTLMRSNFLEEHQAEAGTTELAIIEKNEIAVHSNQYVCGLDPKKIVTESGYNKEFDLPEHSIPWVTLYGDGFVPDFSKALASFYKNMDPKAKDTATEYYPEFIGDAKRLDLQVYCEIRKQLAEYIRLKMKEELEKFGVDAAEEYWTNKAKLKKDRFIDLICKKVYQEAHLEVDWGEDNLCIENIETKSVGPVTQKYLLNEDYSSEAYGLRIVRVKDIFDDHNHAKCTIFYWFSSGIWKNMECFIQEKLPKVFNGFGVDDSKGNSLLNVTDAVGDLKNPLSEHYRNFYMCMGFSKTGWKQTYYTWLKENGLEDEINRLEDERKHALKRKKEEERQAALISVEPYKPRAFLDEFVNKEELVAVELALDQIFPGKRLRSFAYDAAREPEQKNHAIEVTTTIPVKGNKEKIQQLLDFGWMEGPIHVEHGCRTLSMRYVLS